MHFAAAGVVAGHYDVVVAGGVESMSRVPMGSSTAVGVTCFRSGLWTVTGISRTRG
ncbi:thiolase, N-terminal domain protein [Mycobacterium xenopi 3993]|nr:thiolase, N-terminal domain protein [Mycobacterium xenopi 3993]